MEMRTERNAKNKGVRKQTAIREGKVLSPFILPADLPFKFLEGHKAAAVCCSGRGLGEGWRFTCFS